MELNDYIQGKKHGKEANRLEREALNNPFLQEAMDGFDKVAGNHSYAIQSLEKELQKRIQSKEKSTNRLWWLGIAASLVLVTGLGTLLLFNNKPTDYIAVVEMSESEEDYLSELTNHDTANLYPPAASQSDEVKTVAEAKISRQEASPDYIFEGDMSVSGLMASEESLDMAEIEEVALVVDKQIADMESSEMERADDFLELKEMVVSDYGAKRKPELSKDYSNPSKSKSQEDFDTTLGWSSGFIDVKTDSLTRSKETHTLFGEKEFKKHFEKNRLKNICSGGKASVKVHFYVDETGTPTNLKVEKSTCDELTKELIRLLESSPKWTTIKQEVKLEIVSEP